MVVRSQGRMSGVAFAFIERLPWRPIECKAMISSASAEDRRMQTDTWTRGTHASSMSVLGSRLQLEGKGKEASHPNSGEDEWIVSETEELVRQLIRVILLDAISIDLAECGIHLCNCVE